MTPPPGLVSRGPCTQRRAPGRPAPPAGSGPSGSGPPPRGSDGANGHPSISSRRSGGSPGRPLGASRDLGSPRVGKAPARARVYGWRGSAMTSPRRAGLDQPAGVHHREPVAGRREHRQVVADHDQRDPALAHQVGEQSRGSAPARSRRAPSSARRRSPGRGSAGQGHRDHHPLPLAAGQLVRVAGHPPRRHADAVEQVACPPPRDLARPPARAAGSARRSGRRSSAPG